MERKFEIELTKLNERIITMSHLTQSQVSLCMKALLDCDGDLARQVIDNDNEIDDLDVKIDKLCQRIFALQQPVASDLRFIMSALKINNDLERIADLAVYVAKRIHLLQDYKEMITELEIDEIIAMTEKVVKDTVVMIESRRTVFVKDVFEEAQLLKERCRGTSSLIIEQMTRKTEVIVVATHLMQILGQVERMAALARNIAESVYFVVEGKIVKHQQGFTGSMPLDNP